MDKIEQLVDMVSSSVIHYIMEDDRLPLEEAMRRFYASEVCQKLEDKETGLYRESPAYVFDLYQIEQKYGKLIQTEE